MKWNFFVLLVIGVFFHANIYAEPLKPAYSPSLLTSITISSQLEFCSERVPTKVQDVREQLEKELMLSLWDRPQVILWLKRSRRYLPHIENMLRKSHMPDDLKYVAIAESALRPHARSKRGAVGFWQFMKFTGQKYGLAINENIDERRNIVASTQAAIRYFTDLYEMFGSWTLAAAAYNMGEDGLMAEIMEQGTTNFYVLYLPVETQRFVFRILSVKLIFSDPERYGFQLSDDDYYPPIQFDLIQIDCLQDTPIQIIAKAAKTHFKVIKDLNPQIRGHHLMAGSHTIQIPKGASSEFLVRYQHFLKKWLVDQEERIYVVKKGDSLSSIAERFNVPLAALLIWNNLDSKGTIRPGDQLIIYRKVFKPVEIDNNKNNRSNNIK
jgi:membrane-bound lytic murein transglycosylase D